MLDTNIQTLKKLAVGDFIKFKTYKVIEQGVLK
jgi:hypothetical protein